LAASHLIRSLRYRVRNRIHALAGGSARYQQTTQKSMHTRKRAAAGSFSSRVPGCPDFDCLLTGTWVRRKPLADSRPSRNPPECLGTAPTPNAPKVS
jgi:hypothetical protein